MISLFLHSVHHYSTVTGTVPNRCTVLPKMVGAKKRRGKYPSFGSTQKIAESRNFLTQPEKTERTNKTAQGTRNQTRDVKCLIRGVPTLKCTRTAATESEVHGKVQSRQVPAYANKLKYLLLLIISIVLLLLILLLLLSLRLLIFNRIHGENSSTAY